MRHNEILLEYNRQVTANQVGNRLLLALAKDSSPFANGTLNGIRTQIKTLGNLQDPEALNAVIDPIRRAKWIEYVLQVIESQDPTPNKAYTPWLAKMYAKSGGGLRLEDMNRNDLLRLYDLAKKRRKIKPEHSDINRFKWYQDFEDTMENEYNNFEDLEANEQQDGKAKKVYNDENVTIIVPEDEEAACKYGRGTRWCTAATRGYNYFNQYNRQGPLYILLPKQPRYQGEKYQLHFPSNQYMDENDDPMDLNELLVRFPGIREFFLKNEPALSDKIAFAPDEVLQQAIESVSEIVRERVWETINDWESDDDSYMKTLIDNGLIDQDGDVDWDEVERFGLTYSEYNPEVIRWENDIINAATPTPEKLRKIIADDPYEYESFDTIKHIPDVIGKYLTSKYYGRRDEGDANIGKYLREKISMRKEGDKWLAYYVGPGLRLPRITNEGFKKTLGTIGAAGALAAAGLAGYNMSQQPQYGQPVTRIDLTNKTQNQNPDLRVLAQTIWGEARSHGAQGMLAVGNVIKNRAEDVKHSRLFGQGIRGVALKPKQFSCWNKGDPNQDRLREILQYDKLIRHKKSPDKTPFAEWLKKFKHSSDYLDYKAWITAKSIAKKILNGTAPDPTKGATYYHTTGVQPIWRHDLTKVAQFGNHIFYTLPEKINEYNVDNKEGLGATGYNANVDYRGIRVLMRPSIFLKLAFPLSDPPSKKYIMQYMQNGGSLGSPYLLVDIPHGYFNDNFADYPKVVGHEGRNRMMAIFEIEGDDPVEVHLFPYGEIRARDLNSEIVHHMQVGMINQPGNKIVTNGTEGIFEPIKKSG